MNLGKTVERTWSDALRIVLDAVYVLRRTGSTPWLLVFGLAFIVLLPQGREMVRWLS